MRRIRRPVIRVPVRLIKVIRLTVDIRRRPR